MPDDYLQMFARPIDLCKEIGFVNRVLALANNEPLNEWDMRFNKKIYYKTKPPGIQLRDYILNTIPSEIYNIQNHLIKEKDFYTFV